MMALSEVSRCDEKMQVEATFEVMLSFCLDCKGLYGAGYDGVNELLF